MGTQGCKHVISHLIHATYPQKWNPPVYEHLLQELLSGQPRPPEWASQGNVLTTSPGPWVSPFPELLLLAALRLLRGSLHFPKCATQAAKNNISRLHPRHQEGSQTETGVLDQWFQTLQGRMHSGAWAERSQADHWAGNGVGCGGAAPTRSPGCTHHSQGAGRPASRRNG